MIALPKFNHGFSATDFRVFNKHRFVERLRVLDSYEVCCIKRIVSAATNSEYLTDYDYFQKI